MTPDNLAALQDSLAERCPDFSDLTVRLFGQMRVVLEYREPDGRAVKHVIALEEDEPFKRWEGRIIERIRSSLRVA